MVSDPWENVEEKYPIGSKEQESPENRRGDSEKSLGDYLRRGGRFAVEKIRTTIFRKPRS